ncbi:MAG: hypothetical protein NC120_11850 [Ruminococcus sp.]|nr:hypothetical protein [Ruminococcus sp.]
MKNNTPLGRLRVFPLIITEIVAFFLLLPMASIYLSEEHHTEWHELTGANGDAKVLYTNISTYLTKTEAKNGKESTENISGVFTGSLKTSGTPETAPNASFDGSPEDIDCFLKAMMGRDSSSFYYVCIKKGVPVQTYWSKHKSLIKYAEKLTRDIENDTRTENAYIGGYVLGGFPTEIRKYGVPTPPYTEAETRLNAVCSAERMITEQTEYFLTVWPPLIVISVIYILISRFTDFGRKRLRKARGSHTSADIPES